LYTFTVFSIKFYILLLDFNIIKAPTNFGWCFACYYWKT